MRCTGRNSGNLLCWRRGARLQHAEGYARAWSPSVDTQPRPLPPPAQMAALVFDKQRFLRDLRRGVLTPAQLTRNLCFAASHDTSSDGAAALLAAGADLDASSDGHPPLMCAMKSANLAVVIRLLCAAGADLHALSTNGEIGLVMSVLVRLHFPGAATEAAYVNVLRALSGAGRDITRCHGPYGRPCSTLRAAAATGKPKLLQLLIDAGAPFLYL